MLMSEDEIQATIQAESSCKTGATTECASRRPSDCQLYHVSTEMTEWPRSADLPPCCPIQSEKTITTGPDLPTTSLEPKAVRLEWQLNAVVPCVFVLHDGLLRVLLANVSWRKPERH